MKSLPGRGVTSSQLATRGSSDDSEQQDLGLNRIGVLELVDEDARELLLQVRADAGVGLDQVAGARQQIGEIERAAGRLQLLVAGRRAGQLLLQRRRQVGVGVPAKLLKIRKQLVPRREHLGARDVRAVLVAAALSRAREAAIAREIDEPRLPAVEIALAERLLEPNLPAQAAHAVGVDVQVVARKDGAGGEIGEAMERVHEAIDFRRAIERRPPPRPRIIAPLGQRAAGAAQPIDGTVGGRAREPGKAARSPQRPPQALGRILQRLLQPRVEGARVQPIRLRLGHDGEERVDARLDGPLPQEIRAEAVDRVDVRFLELRERLLQPLPLFVVSSPRHAPAPALRAAAASARRPLFP